MPSLTHSVAMKLVAAVLVAPVGLACAVPDPPEVPAERTWPDTSLPSSTADGSAAFPAPAVEDQGLGDGKDVVTIGDSYMRLPNWLQLPGSEGVELSLEKAGKRTYRKYGYTGGAIVPPVAVAILNGKIPAQFENARKADPDIKTVVATGGGSDVIDACNGPTTAAALSTTCTTYLDKIDAGIDAMVKQMAAAGVQDLVWVGYGDTATTGKKVVCGALDYLRDKRMAKCVADRTKPGLRCHYVDNKGRPGLKTRDGLHPDAASYDLIGKAVWDRMVAEGVRR